MKKVLIPVTNHATLGETDQVNGTYSPELTHVVHVITAAGLDYEIASIKGGKAPIYGTDIEGDEINTEVLANEDFQRRINNTKAVSQLKVADYDAVFYPGGFGLLSDLAENEDFAKLSAEHYQQGGIIAAVCHGPAALLPIQLNNGEALLATKSVTGFTREEEIDYGTIKDVPFLLEEALTRKAAQFSKVQPWQSFIIEDEGVITGQNPASAHAVGEALVRHLNR
ncbi:type 1 glutamine amidotransferase domain-containing protein [Catenovulum maritimum]|uniref:Thiamine biosynthesis protein ThiJ n=1 Tax=Catenovulum maritimum TaxID=1513271 RepID=A0A0J8GQD1_9ALTE|nr:type 1 glutamine amidotransferase domain-containing protein [Catenovulum maritimum]KMT64947.1 thiamine biosynthesis protein ThiJ [Catenovulum maritimum]